MYLKLLSMAVLLSSCTNFMIRQQCDKINWYQQGQEIAMRGDRISNDEMVMQCRRAEAEIGESKLDQGFKAGMSLYCQPDTVFQTGKNGDLFNAEFCETNGMNLLKKRHAEGLLAYCRAGMTAGLSGKKYKNVCSEDLEKTFIPEYRKGRKKYLSALLQNNQVKKQQLDSEAARLQGEKASAQFRLTRIPLVKTGEKDPYFTERNSISSELNSLSSAIYQKSTERAKVDKEIDDFQKELATLD